MSRLEERFSSLFFFRLFFAAATAADFASRKQPALAIRVFEFRAPLDPE
jgi:hypothetical protein